MATAGTVKPMHCVVGATVVSHDAGITVVMDDGSEVEIGSVADLGRETGELRRKLRTAELARDGEAKEVSKLTAALLDRQRKHEEDIVALTAKYQAAEGAADGRAEEVSKLRQANEKLLSERSQEYRGLAAAGPDERLQRAVEAHERAAEQKGARIGELERALEATTRQFQEEAAAHEADVKRWARAEARWKKKGGELPLDGVEGELPQRVRDLEARLEAELRGRAMDAESHRNEVEQLKRQRVTDRELAGTLEPFVVRPSGAEATVPGAYLNTDVSARVRILEALVVRLLDESGRGS